MGQGIHLATVYLEANTIGQTGVTIEAVPGTSPFMLGEESRSGLLPQLAVVTMTNEPDESDRNRDIPIFGVD